MRAVRLQRATRLCSTAAARENAEQPTPELTTDDVIELASSGERAGENPCVFSVGKTGTGYPEAKRQWLSTASFDRLPKAPHKATDPGELASRFSVLPPADRLKVSKATLSGLLDFEDKRALQLFLAVGVRRYGVVAYHTTKMQTNEEDQEFWRNVAREMVRMLAEDPEPDPKKYLEKV
ncbi:hypothetical protein DIPPA_12427 [Diplonema papillatum]|nr:hypothetical protein DIPPA_12427 [Diplonema papillatum]KAJ9459413.1 hypothetical protein DIPPA_12427 [Diplonema papillatum]